MKLRGALGETGDGEGVAALTPVNLCWQFQFPAEKDISHSCLKNPNHTVFFIKLVKVTGFLMSAATSLPFIIDDHNLNSKLDTEFSVMFTNYFVNFSAINTLKKK